MRRASWALFGLFNNNIFHNRIAKHIYYTTQCRVLQKYFNYRPDQTDFCVVVASCFLLNVLIFSIQFRKVMSRMYETTDVLALCSQFHHALIRKRALIFTQKDNLLFENPAILTFLLFPEEPNADFSNIRRIRSCSHLLLFLYFPF